MLRHLVFAVLLLNIDLYATAATVQCFSSHFPPHERLQDHAGSFSAGAPGFDCLLSEATDLSNDFEESGVSNSLAAVLSGAAAHAVREWEANQVVRERCCMFTLFDTLSSTRCCILKTEPSIHI